MTRELSEDEIKVGDEVICQGMKGIVTFIDELGYQIMDEDGESGFYITDDIRKTSRHFPQISEVLEMMKGEVE